MNAHTSERSIIRPDAPDGWVYTGDSGFLTPTDIKLTPLPSITPLELIAGTTIQAPEDIRCDDDYEYEPNYLWRDPAAALNRVISENNYQQLKLTFGELHKYSNSQDLLALLNSAETEESLDKAMREYYSLIESVERKADDEVLSNAGIWDFLGLMANHFMIQTNMRDLPMSDQLESLLSRGLDSEHPPEKLLDFIANFDVPSSIAKKLMDCIDTSPNHPLYWWVASRCPDHPRVVKERASVRSYIRGESDITSIEHPQALLPLGLLLDETEYQFPKSGLELETNCPVKAVKVPEGTKMGLDVADVEKILELRLNDARNADVLIYDKQWLRRYFEIWRWEKVSRSISSSIHLHSDGCSDLKLERAAEHFGEDEDDCRENYRHNTVEVRTALSGYVMDKGDESRGFDELPHPSLLELMHSCENPASLIYTLALVRIMSTPYRFRIISDLGKEIADPSERRTTIYDRHESTAIRSREEVEAAEEIAELTLDDENCPLEDLIEKISLLSIDMQKRTVEATLINSDSYLLERLMDSLSDLAPSLQEQITESVLVNRSDVSSYLSYKVSALVPDLQERVVEAVIALKDSTELSYLAPSMSDLIPSLQKRIVDTAVTHGFVYTLERLALELPKLAPDIRESVAEAFFAICSDSSITILLEHAPSLTPGLQVRVVEKLLACKVDWMLELFAEQVPDLAPYAQTRALESGLVHNMALPYNMGR